MDIQLAQTRHHTYSRSVTNSLECRGGPIPGLLKYEGRRKKFIVGRVEGGNLDYPAPRSNRPTTATHTYYTRGDQQFNPRALQVHRDKEQLAHYLVNAIGAQRNARHFLQAIVRVQLSPQSELQMYELSRRMNGDQSEQGMGQPGSERNSVARRDGDRCGCLLTTCFQAPWRLQCAGE